MGSVYAGKYQGDLRVLSGRAMVGAKVEVRIAGTSTLATLYNGPVAIAGSTSADRLENPGMASTGIPVASGEGRAGLDAGASLTFWASTLATDGTPAAYELWATYRDAVVGPFLVHPTTDVREPPQAGSVTTGMIDPAGIAQSAVTGLAAALAGTASSTALATEATTRAAADSTLTTNVAANAGAITSEAAARAAADALLIPKTLADANSVLAAVADDTPLALAVPASTVVGRKASGNVAALTGADVAGLIPSGTYVPIIGGRVGIGTPTPSVDLDVAGNSKVSGNIAIGANFSGPGKVFIDAPMTNVANADGMVITIHSTVNVNGFFDMFGISSQNTDQIIPVGISDTGSRTGVTGDAYSANPAFAGTLALQIGLRGRAGFAAGGATSGAVVTQAAGGYFVIRNEAAGTTITSAYGVFIYNGDTSGGTITDRYDLYASSVNAKSYFAGKVGIGTTGPATPLHIVPGNDNANDLGAITLQNLGENGTKLAFNNTFGPLVSVVGTKMGGGGLADDGLLVFNTAVNSVLAERMRITNVGNVGIGTTNPGTKLEVSSSGGESIRLSGSGTASNAVRVINTGNDVYFGSEGATAGGFFTGSLSYAAVIYSNTAIQHIIGGTSRMIVTTTGNVGIGGAPNANAMLDVQSTTKAFMPPRMTTTQRDAIASPTAGMVVYNSTTNKLNVYTTTWEAVTSA